MKNMIKHNKSEIIQNINTQTIFDSQKENINNFSRKEFVPVIIEAQITKLPLIKFGDVQKKIFTIEKLKFVILYHLVKSMI